MFFYRSHLLEFIPFFLIVSLKKRFTCRNFLPILFLSPPKIIQPVTVVLPTANMTGDY